MKSTKALPKDKNELIIHRGNLIAGRLRRTSDGCSFEYDPRFLTHRKLQGLSFCMKKSRTPLILNGTNLHPFFAGLLPEGMRLTALVRNLKTSPDDLFSLFAATGSHVIGDVFVHTENQKADKENFPKLKDIDFESYFHKILDSNSYSLGEDAISGVQEKISASVVRFPLNISGEHRMSLVKLNPKDKPNLVENEFFCMKMAQKCGIDVASVKFVKDRLGKLGLLVHRFDRIWDEKNKRFILLHQEDACQFLDKYPSEKYRISFGEIADGIEKYATAPKATLLKLLRIKCFSYLIGNGDMHAKNISLLTNPQGFTDLTPAYDLVCTYIYGDEKMALKIDGKDSNLKRAGILKFTDRYMLPRPAVEKMVDRLIADFKKNISILGRIPVDPKKSQAFRQMVQRRLQDLDRV